MFGFLLPILVYKVLLADSDYWQGFIDSQFTGSIVGAASRATIRTPLIDAEMDVSTARALSTHMEGLESYCPRLSYSQLELPGVRTITQALLGAGGTARVFKGTHRTKERVSTSSGRYKNEPVAIKMLYCLQLTPETVGKFFRETALTSRLRHPNIVQVRGVCVLPPAICMVMELCHGSLFDRLRIKSDTGIDWDTRLAYAVDCARGVACLHSQRDPVVHMDLKSANFLVGTQRVFTWTVKDVQQWLVTCRLGRFCQMFGYHRVKGESLLRHDADSLARMLGQEAKGAGADDFRRLTREVAELVNSVDKANPSCHVIKLTDLELSQSPGTVPGDGVTGGGARDGPADTPQTVNWTSPEVISGGKGACSTASDVYSCVLPRASPRCCPQPG